MLVCLDVLELRIALLGRGACLFASDIGARRVAQGPEQSCHCGRTGGMAALLELAAQVAQRAALVFASTHRITRGLGREQLLEHTSENRVTCLGNRSAPAFAANTTRGRALQLLIELARTALNRLVGQTRHASHELDAAMTMALGLKCAPPATLLLVETRHEHVGLVMQSGQCLIGSRETRDTPACMNLSVGHEHLIRSRQRFLLSTPVAQCQPGIVTGQV